MGEVKQKSKGKQKSISSDAKREICQKSFDGCCLKAVFSALIHCAGAIGFSSSGMSVSLDTDNNEVFLLSHNIVQRLYGGEAVKEGGKTTIKGSFITDMLLDLHILKQSDGFKVEEGIHPALIRKDCCKAAYLAGAFLGGGSLTVSGGYHLEFACLSKKLRDDLTVMLTDLGIKAGTAVRGEGFIAYIKDADCVSDCLVVMGASGTCLELNSLFAQRSMKQNASRAANCDMANLTRLVSASFSQRQAIEKIIARCGEIKNAKLREAAEARTAYPDFNYEELAVILGISKSTVKYRLNRLVEMANEF